MLTKLETLKVFNISTEEDIQMYKAILDQIDPTNPYYKIELLNVTYNQENELKYFVLEIDESPSVLMPFYLREIVIGKEKTPYYDVISPWGYTGPLFKGGISEEVANDFWSFVDQWYKEHHVISEFVRFNFTYNYQYYTGEASHTLKNVRGRILEEEVLWNNFKYNVRKNYRNATKNDLIYEMTHKNISRKKMEEFYDIYIGTMNRHTASETFYHSIDYFIDFVENNPNHCTLAMVYKDGKAISTELLLLSNDTMFSFLGGTHAEYFKLRPNDFLKIHTLNWAREMGFSYYVIGGGLKDGDSLYQYKKKFFPEDEDLNFFTGRKIINQEVYDSLVLQANSLIIEKSEDVEDTDDGFFPKYRINM